MSPADFDRAAARTRLRPPSIKMARRYLVDGVLNFRALGREFNVHANTVAEKVAVIQREARLLSGAPANWVVQTVVVPPSVARQIITLRDQAWRAAGLLVGQKKPRR